MVDHSTEATPLSVHFGHMLKELAQVARYCALVQRKSHMVIVVILRLLEPVLMIAPPQGSLVPVLQHLLEEKGGTEAIQDMLAGLGLVTLARLDKDAAAGAPTSAGPAAGPAAHISCDDTRCAVCQRLAGGRSLHCSSCRCMACLYSCGEACRLCRHAFCNPCFTKLAPDRPRRPGPYTGQPADVFSSCRSRSPPAWARSKAP